MSALEQVGYADTACCQDQDPPCHPKGRRDLLSGFTPHRGLVRAMSVGGLVGSVVQRSARIEVERLPCRLIFAGGADAVESRPDRGVLHLDPGLEGASGIRSLAGANPVPAVREAPLRDLPLLRRGGHTSAIDSEPPTSHFGCRRWTAIRAR